MRRKILPNGLFSSSKTPPRLAKLKYAGRASFNKSDKIPAAAMAVPKSKNEKVQLSLIWVYDTSNGRYFYADFTDVSLIDDNDA